MGFLRRKFVQQGLMTIVGLLSLGGIVMENWMKIASSAKKVKVSQSVPDRHWVGDGFYVHGLLRPSEALNTLISPFLLVDYASPHHFEKTEQRRGVGEHPHRGFETVTFAYQGEIEHRDSSGGGGIISPGGVQWMTAGKGVVHDEFHSRDFSSKGGSFEMVQLWVNLPKQHKMVAPKYQGYDRSEIPEVSLDNGGVLRVIAGEYDSVQGPASTFSPLQVYDISYPHGGSLSIPLGEETNTLMLIMSGRLDIEGGQRYNEQSLLVFEPQGTVVRFVASSNFKALLLNGKPLREPVVAHGPFVMTTKSEISQAIKDYQSGKMGKLSPGDNL